MIFLQIAHSCIDDTAFLTWSRERLAAECELSLHTLERHLPALEKLKLITQNEGGFRLPEFYALRQNGGQIGSQNGGAIEEGVSWSLLESPSSTSSKPSKKTDDDEDREKPGTSPLEESEIQRLTLKVESEFKLTPQVARCVVLVGVLRTQGRESIRSAKYFTEVLGQMHVEPLPQGYAEYLEMKLGELRAKQPEAVAEREVADERRG